ncbi:MAG: hypothetical protein DRI93_07165, partial [Aquificota bacterium]
LAQTLGPEPLLGGLCKISAFKTAPRLIRHVGVEPDLPQERRARSQETRQVEVKPPRLQA